MKNGVGEDLLIRYVIDEATIDERLKVESWAKTDGQNAKELERVKFIIDNSRGISSLSPADPEEEWQKFMQARTNTTTETKIVTLRSYSRWLQLAAALLLVCGGGILFKIVSDNGKNEETITIATQNIPQNKTLPDGTTVFMNRFSTISYSANYKNNRQVKLSGEAFFKVIHNVAQPFSVQTSKVKITDIGTSFNVFNRGENVSVVVEEGLVEVSASKTRVELSKGEKLSVNIAGNLTEKVKSTDHLHDYYRTGEFTTDHTPLLRLVEVLNQAYNTNITFGSEELESIPITGNFKMESLDKILNVIQISTPEITFRKSDDKIMLEKR